MLLSKKGEEAPLSQRNDVFCLLTILRLISERSSPKNHFTLSIIPPTTHKELRSYFKKGKDAILLTFHTLKFMYLKTTLIVDLLSVLQIFLHTVTTPTPKKLIIVFNLCFNLTTANIYSKNPFHAMLHTFPPPSGWTILSQTIAKKIEALYGYVF